jgi:hypothetical protein
MQQGGHSPKVRVCGKGQSVHIIEKHLRAQCFVGWTLVPSPQMSGEDVEASPYCTETGNICGSVSHCAWAFTPALGSKLPVD